MDNCWHFVFSVVVFFVFSALSGTEAVQCYTCSYNGHGVNIECVNNPGQSTLSSPITNCAKGCFVKRVEDANGKVQSFDRSCEATNVQSCTFGCNSWTLGRECTRKCTTALCNDGDGRTRGDNCKTSAGTMTARNTWLLAAAAFFSFGVVLLMRRL